MPVDCCWWSGHIFCVRLCRLLGLGSFVTVDFCSWGSHCWCCDCDACWSWWSACSRFGAWCAGRAWCAWRCLVCLALPGVPGVAWCAWYAWRAWCAWRAWSYALSGDFLSSGCRRRSASGGFDWRDVAQVAVPFACGLFSSVGRFYRSSSVRGSGPGVSSTLFWSLLHWKRLSMVLPAALVDCCLASLRAGVCSPPWRWRISARVLMVAYFPPLRGRRSAPSHIPWPFLDLTLVLSRCKNLAWLVS